MVKGSSYCVGGNADGDIDSNEPVVVRVHMKNALTDAFGSQESKSWPLRDALQQVAKSKQGVVVVLSLPDGSTASAPFAWVMA